MAAKTRELQMLQVPENGFQYEAPLDVQADQNAKLQADEEVQRALAQVADASIDKPTKDWANNGENKDRRWSLNRLSGENDLDLVNEATDTRHFWKLVLEKYPPRAGNYTEIYDYLADIRPHAKVSESKPCTSLHTILQSIHEQIVKADFKPKNLQQPIVLPEIALLEAVRIYGSSKAGLGTFPLEISHLICLCGLVWLANQTQTLPKFWDRYFQLESDPNFSFEDSAAKASANASSSEKPASNLGSKKRKRDVRETQRRNAQRAREGKARQASLEGVDVDGDILKDLATEGSSQPVSGQNSYGCPITSAMAGKLRLYPEATIKRPGNVLHTADNLPPSEVPTTSTTQPKAPGVVLCETPAQLRFPDEPDQDGDNQILLASYSSLAAAFGAHSLDLSDADRILRKLQAFDSRFQDLHAEVRNVLAIGRETLSEIRQMGSNIRARFERLEVSVTKSLDQKFDDGHFLSRDERCLV